MRRLVGLCAWVLVLFGAGNALALDIPLHDLRVGIRGGPNINIITEVSESDPEPIYPGFVGVGWFIGGAISYDYMDIVGVSIELLYSSESTSGTAEFDGDVGTDNRKEESDFTLSNSALHLPIYVRGQVPGGVARPFLHLGVDLVLSRSGHDLEVEQNGDAAPFTDGCTPGIDCDPFPQQNYQVSGVDSQTFFLAGLGIDIDVGPVTIPIEFRGLFNFGHGDSITDRTSTTNGGTPFLYDNDLTYQVMVLFGANYVISDEAFMAIDGNSHPPINVPGNGQLKARFTTSMGVMEAVLYEHEAPNTVANFVGLALGTKSWVDPNTSKPGQGPYYNGTIFHRVIPNFMIQGGDRTGTGRGGPGYRFRDEFNPKLRHSGPGTLSMANSGPNTNGSQFFICEVATPHLDNRHSVFGKVVSGVDLIATITRVPTDARDKPLSPVVLETLEIFRG